MWFKCGFYLSLICFIHGAKILCLMQTPMYSHYQVVHTLCRELAIRGHSVTLVSPYNETENENLTSIVVNYNQELVGVYKKKLSDSVTDNVLKKNEAILDFLFFVMEQMLNSSEVQNLLKSNKQFDAIVMQQNQNDAMKGFCHHFGIPCISVSTISSCRWTNPYMSNSGPPSYVPDMLTNFHSHMNFYERFWNSLSYFVLDFHTYLYTYSKQEAALKKYFPNAPNLNHLLYNASLMLVNAHYSVQSAVPYGPNMIEVGGLHVLPPKSLPEDVQTFLDNAKEGAIYFSLGSNIKSSFLSNKVKTAILNTFAKLKQRVICKWDEEVSVNRDNIKIHKWLPQNDILAHPNVKLFITQGGQMSLIEAVYHGVPLLGIPVISDQYNNLAGSAHFGYALRVYLNDFTQDKFESAVNELLNNKKYYNAAKKYSQIFHDQPMKPLDKAVFWIEHIIRHKGGSHLRPSSANLTWYQFYLLDVITTIIILVVVVLIVSAKLFKILIAKFKSKTTFHNNISKKIE